MELFLCKAYREGADRVNAIRKSLKEAMVFLSHCCPLYNGTNLKIKFIIFQKVIFIGHN